MQINADGTTNGQDLRGGVLPALPVSAFVESILGQPDHSIKFTFSTTGPFDTPTSMSFSMAGQSNAAFSTDDLSWDVSLTGTATQTPEPGTVFLAALALSVPIVRRTIGRATTAR